MYLRFSQLGTQGRWTAEASHVRFLRHLRRWTTRQCLRRSCTGTAAIGRLTNRRGERTTAAIRHALLFSLLAHPPFIGLGVQKTKRAKEKRKARVASSAERGLEWIRISRSSDGIVPRFLLLRLLLCSFLHSYTATSERRLVSRSMPRKCPSRYIPHERSQNERIALKSLSWESL